MLIPLAITITIERGSTYILGVCKLTFPPDGRPEEYIYIYIFFTAGFMSFNGILWPVKLRQNGHDTKGTAIKASILLIFLSEHYKYKIF